MEGTYSAEHGRLTEHLVFDVVWNAFKVEDKRGKHLPIMFLPLADGIQILVDLNSTLAPLSLPGCRLPIAGGLELLLEGRHRCTAPATRQTVTTRLGVIYLDDLLLRRRLAVGQVPLLAGMGALPLAADLRRA